MLRRPSWTPFFSVNFFQLKLFILLTFIFVSFGSLLNTGVRSFASTTNMNIVDDVFVTQAMPSRNQYFRDHLGAGFGYYQGSFLEVRSLLKIQNTVPQGALVSSARLKMRQYTDTVPGNGTWKVYAGLIEQDWNSREVNWFNQPRIGIKTNQISVNGGIRDFEIDVTQIVREWASGRTNHGIAILSDNKFQGGWLCSVRENRDDYNGGSTQRCPNQGARLEVNYVQNSSPLEPVLLTPNNGDRFGGFPYNSGTQNDQTKNCQVDYGCEITIKFGNIDDPDRGTGGEYSRSWIVAQPLIAGEYKQAEFFHTGQNEWKTWLKDGRYRIWARVQDKLGFQRDSNLSSEIVIDTTKSELSQINSLPDYSPGTQVFVQSQNTNDTHHLSNPIQYEFCRWNDAEFKNDEHCSGWMDTAEFGFGQLQDEQTYYFRVRTRDSVSRPNQTYNYSDFTNFTKTIVDATSPIVQQIEYTKLANVQDKKTDTLSSYNQDGHFDSTAINFTLIEKHLADVSFTLYDPVQSKVIYSEVVCDTNTQNISLNCKQFEVEPSKYQGRFDFSGKDIPDGVYRIVLKVRDKAGNQASDDSLVLRIDNTPGQINISSPQTNSFTNQNSIDLNGQVVSQDEVSLTLINQLGQNQIINLNSINQNQSYIFSHPVNLEMGENRFQLISTDSLKNVSNQEVKITKETETPTLNKFEIENKASLISPDRRPKLSFDLTDQNQQGYGQSGINLDSLNLSLSSIDQQEIKLIQNGQTVSGLGKIDSDCLQTQQQTQGSADCKVKFLFQQDLQPDGVYQANLEIKDFAGNALNTSNSFQIDSHTHLNLQSPSPNSVFARKKVTFVGFGEKGARLQISNSSKPQQNKFIYLDETWHDRLGFDLEGNELADDDELLASSFQIDCNHQLNFDNTGKSKQVCKWQVDLHQDFSTRDETIINQNIFRIEDGAGNQESQNIQTGINLFAVDLEVTPDQQFISADGNGKQDQINFATKISNPNNPEDEILVAAWQLEIRDEKNEIIRQIEGQNSLPSLINFDGKDNQGNWISDGNYTWNLKVNTLDNSLLHPTSGAFKNVTQNTAGIFITYPAGATNQDPFITSSAMVNVQGQASLPTTTANSVRFEEVKVSLCIDTISLNGGCDFEVEADVDENGFFSTLAPLNRLGNITDHVLQARLLDKFGNQSSVSNEVFVRVNTLEPFKNVQIIPTYSGINSTAKLTRLHEASQEWQTRSNLLNQAIANSNQSEIDQLKSELVELEKELKSEVDGLRQIILRSTVTQDTSYVQTKFTSYNNLKSADNQRQISNNIGWIDDNDFSFTRNVLSAVPIDLSNQPQTKKCDQSECVWDIYYPAPDLAGGIYEIGFTGRKGDLIQTITSSLILDANILAKPTIFDINKVYSGSDIQDLGQFDGAYYTNHNTIQIKGVASPNTQIQILDTLTSQTICQTQTSSIGIFNCESKLSTQLSSEVEFRLKVVSTIGSGDFLKSEASENDTILKYDQTIPQLADYQNLNNEHTQAVNQFLNSRAEQCETNLGVCDGFYRQSGDKVEIQAKSNENLGYLFIQNRGEKFKYPFLLNQNLANGFFQIEGYSQEGKYDVNLELSDRAGNKNKLTKTYWVDNTSPDKPEQDFTDWAKYTAFARRDLIIAKRLELPANNRLLAISSSQNYVIKEDKMIFTGYAEEQTYPVLVVDNREVQTTLTNPNQCRQIQQKSKITDDGFVTKSNKWCKFSFEYQFGQEKTYRVQLRTEDRSGNFSNLTQQYLIEYDRTPPSTFNVINAKTKKSNLTPFELSLAKRPDSQITDWRLNGAQTYYPEQGNLNAITNTNGIVFDGFTESLADVEYIVTHPKGYQVDYQKFENKFEQYHQTKIFDLGGRKDQGNESCLRVVDTRQIGVCDDGKYQISYRSGDSADNETDLKTFTIERDTVNPLRPVVELSKNGDILGEYLGVKIKGEKFTRAEIRVFQEGDFVRTVNVQLNKSGLFESSDLLGKLECDSQTYQLRVKLYDRAGNDSTTTTRQVTTEDCPFCANFTETKAKTRLTKPIHSDKAYIGYPFGYSGQYFNSSKFHTGVDYNGVPKYTPIYAAAKGVVISSHYKEYREGVENLGYGNYVKIRHENGLETVYGHLAFENNDIVRPGDQVNTSTMIGKMGSTGFTTGPHLHFEVWRKGKLEDPQKYLVKEKSNLTPEQYAKVCTPAGTGGEEDVNISIESWATDNKSPEMIVINFEKKLVGSGGVLKSIENFNPYLGKAVDLTEVQYGLSGTSHSGNYRIYGVAPFTNMTIKINLWEENKLVEERYEDLNNAQWQARKNSISPFDDTIVNWKDNNHYSGNVNFDVKTKWSIDASWEAKKITEQDEVWIDSKITHSTDCFGGSCKVPGITTTWRNEKASNRIKLESGKSRIPDSIARGSGIQEVFEVRGDSSDKSKYTKADDASVRLLKLNAVGEVRPESNVWILSHGWNGGLDVMKEIAEKIKKDEATKNDSVFVLDWREVSHSGGNPLDVCVASTWTNSSAQAIKKKLSDWGFSDKSKLRLVGHSLGTILNTEVGKEFNQSFMSINLDPPSDPCHSYNGEGYNVKGESVHNSGNKKSDLSFSAERSRSFVGKHSLAGSQEHNRTAHKSFQIMFGTWRTTSYEHSWVQETWSLMLDSDRLEENTLGASDTKTHSSWQRNNNLFGGWENNHGRLYTKTKIPNMWEKIAPGDIEKLEYYQNNKILSVYKK